MRISSKRSQRDLSLFPFHLSPVTGRGDFGGKQWRCQQLVPLSAGGQVEKEASLNVREWIREADYASEVRAEARRKSGAGRGNFSECACSSSVGVGAQCTHSHIACACL